jgi:hypothetical protein
MQAWKLTRSGTLDPNPMSFIQSAGIFSSSLAPGTVLLTTRVDAGLEHFMLVPESSATAQSAAHLAHAVAARADLADVAPVLDQVASVAWLRTERVPTLTSRDTQSGSDPAAVSRALAISMRPGQWVAVALRTPTQRERRWQLTWLESQMNTANPQYHSRRSDSLVATFYAGADTTEEAAQLLREAAAAMPGFDMATRHDTTSRGQDSFPFFAGSGAAAAIGALLVAQSSVDLPVVTTVAAFVVAALAVVLGALTLTGRIKLAHEQLRAGLTNLRLPIARPLVIPPTKPQKEKTHENGNVTKAKGGGYGFSRSAFLVGQEIPVSLIAPHAGNASGEMSTMIREAPAATANIIGPRIGTSAKKWVALSARDLWQGVAFFGVPGSGKSVALRNLWAWASMERANPSGTPGFPGATNSIIALETKGSGAAIYQALATKVGDSVGLSDLTDQNTPAIDMFPRIGTIEEQARSVTNAMKYVWGEQSIGAHSFNMLTRIFTGALVVTPAITAQVQGLRQNASFFYYANVLLGGIGDEAAVGLGSAILSEAARVKATDEDDLGIAAQLLSTLFGPGVTPAQRKTATEAPRNKAGALLIAEGWWNRSTKVSWDDVLVNHWGIIVNVGSSVAGAQVDNQLKDDMSGMLMYSLRDAINRKCTGWQAQGRSVSIFADELSEIAGQSSEVIEWLKDKGRDFGVVPVFATQRSGQLTPQVRESVLGFGTIFAYTQDVPAVMSQIVSDLTADGSEWTNADVANLPRYEAIVRTRINSVRQPPFTVKLTNFETIMESYAHIQRVAGPGDVA